ncbi:MAG: hypothetical protein JO244_05750 [Solirubrobacterales bacterium]|nr:hypothetical protein [Solirubrobacterales bacterium]
MRHTSDGLLRRLDDEPLAVPDRVTDHVAGCGRCQERRAEIGRDTERAAQLFSAPQLVPDLDLAWARLRPELESPGATRADRQSRPPRLHRRLARFRTMSLRTGLAIGGITIVVAGTAAAASLTTIFAPTRVAAVSLNQSDLRAIAAFTGLGNSQGIGGFSSPTGSSRLRFGTLTWTSGSALAVSSLAQAVAQAGFPVTLPTHLPPGVGAVQQFAVLPRMQAAIRFNSAAGGLGGSTVALTTGPGVVTDYAGKSGTDVPTLGVATMRRPTARSAGATLGQVEAFLLRQPGIPPELAEEIRLLGDLRTTLPVPVPPGASVRSVQVSGWPGVLLADSSKAASAVVWEDGRGLLHAVVGILDPRDVLNVAAQIG